MEARHTVHRASEFQDEVIQPIARYRLVHAFGYLVLVDEVYEKSGFKHIINEKPFLRIQHGQFRLDSVQVLGSIKPKEGLGIAVPVENVAEFSE
jgi:hypothetical protein